MRQCLGQSRRFSATLIAKARFIGQNLAQKVGALAGTAGEAPMHGIGKSSAAMAAALLFVCGLLLLGPTEAFAQFNIDSLIRGAMSHGNQPGYRYHSGSSSSHHSKSHAKDDDDSSSSKSKGKEKDATQDEPQSNGASARAQPSGPVQNTARSTESDSPAAASSAKSKSYDDQPAFAPAR
jgi:hypothetical protein